MPVQTKSIVATTEKEQRILIVDSDEQFREGLYNFLLAAGYEDVDATETYSQALEKIKKSAYHVVVSEAGSRTKGGLTFAEHLAKAIPGVKIILMIKVEDQKHWTEKDGSTGFQFLLKPTFPQNLLYLLHS